MSNVIQRVEILMVDLVPSTRRVDAIQSFVSQETPIVRIFDSDGAIGTGYCYTIGASVRRSSSTTEWPPVPIV